VSDTQLPSAADALTAMLAAIDTIPPDHRIVRSRIWRYEVGECGYGWSVDLNYALGTEAARNRGLPTFQESKDWRVRQAIGAYNLALQEDMGAEGRAEEP
jgi:hypothetical protein